MDNDVAVVGLACRVPGAANYREFWRNVRAGVESIRFLDDQELLAEGVEPGLLRNPAYVRSAGGFLEGAGEFDADFFGMTPREAELLDPQQRLFLECAWQALEDAGCDNKRYPGLIGVYGGVSRQHYFFENVLSRPDLIEAVGEVQAAMASDKDSVTARVAYLLDLRGPSVTIQTACSTSLVAVHSACQSLMGGECDLALAGGVSVTTLRRHGYLYEDGGTYSSDGHCRAFDAQADGMVGGDGVGVVALKRLADARRDRDTVWAVIKGSAIGNDGALRVGFAAPGVDGQARVIRAALQAAAVSADTIGYVEAHGTGTKLGDPIEVAALTQVFRADTQRRGYCALGSVKTNLGHLNAAAGVVGLIKAVLALHHGVIPASLSFTRPNPQIDFGSSPFYVITKTGEWQQPGHRRAGVSSFGMGGTNAHVILEQAPAVPGSEVASRRAQLLVLSAKTAPALLAARSQLADYLHAPNDQELADVAYTLQVGRRRFAHRCAVVASSHAEAVAAIERDAGSGPGPVHAAPEVVFLFPGQGAQYADMGRGLYASETSFRATLDRCAKLLEPELGVDLRSLLMPSSEQRPEATARLAQTALTQPALFVIEYALAQLWISVGVKPAVMVGHSVGELVAACLAGVFSLEGALRLVAARGRLMQSCAPGKMLAVSLPEEQLRDQLDSQLSLCAVNGPSLCVVGGPPAAVESFASRQARRQVTCRTLVTSHAFHSTMMQPIVEPFVRLVREVGCQPARGRCVSSVTGDWITPGDWADPEYWGRNVAQPVRFSRAVQTLLQQPRRVFLEVGPGQTLTFLVQQQAGDPPVSVAASLRPAQADVDDTSTWLGAIGQLWQSGVDSIDWTALHGGTRQRVPLPTYPFERKRYWIERSSSSKPAPATITTPSSTRAPPDAWFWLPSWQRTGRPPADAPPPQGVWLLLTAGDLGQCVQAKLDKSATVIAVEPGDRFECVAERHFRVRPDAREDWDALCAALAAAGVAPDHVVHLWGMQDRTPASAATIDRAVDLGFYSLLFLLGALERFHPASAVKVFLASDRLHQILDAEAQQPECAVAMGPMLAVRHEMPQIESRCIDLDLASGAANELDRAATDLVQECASAESEPIVGYRGGVRWVRTVVRTKLPRSDRLALPEHGVVLITGGLGGVGGAIGEHFARTYQAKIAVLVRTPLPPRQEWADWLAQHDNTDRASRAIRRALAIEQAGGEVLVLQADIAEEAQLSAALQRLRTTWGSIHGVIHAAGLNPGGLIPLRTKPEAQQVLAPKVKGTLLLLEQLASEPLEFFGLCSSLAAVTGGVGAADYCGANAFLDALAQSRAGRARAMVVSVGLDTFREVGMAAETAETKSLSASRAEFLALGMTTSEGVAALTRAIASGQPHVLVSTRDLLPRIAPPDSATALSQPTDLLTDTPSAAVASLAAPPDTESVVLGLLRLLTGIDEVDRHSELIDLGLDSLLAMRLATRVRAMLGVDLRLRAVLETPSVAQLVLLIDQMRAADSESEDWVV